jgi:hypothetical protein
MTTHTLIELGGGLVLGIIALVSFFVSLKTRAKMSRQLLMPFSCHLVLWSFFAFLFFSGAILYLFLGAIAVIYIPSILWILSLPKDDHVA